MTSICWGSMPSRSATIWAKPDGAVDALLAQRVGLLLDLGGIDVLEQPVERGVVVARVVGDADGRLVPGGERRDEVLAPDLQAVHAQLLCELVHGDLDEMGRLRPARPADRIRGEL